MDKVNVELHLGDSAKVLAKMAEASIDLTVTSPPYDNLRTYKGYTFDFDAIANQLFRVTKQGGVVVWVVGDQTVNGSESGTSFKQALYFKSIGFNLHDTMIYQVPGTGAKGSRLAYWQSFEYMFVLGKGHLKTVNLLKDKKNARFGSVHKQSSVGTRLFPAGDTVVGEYGIRPNVWTILSGNNGDDQSDHPAVFPESLAGDHILSWSNPCDTVLDCFMGSGTTGKMAVKHGRNFIGIEIASEYYDIAKRRIEQAQSQLRLFA